MEQLKCGRCGSDIVHVCVLKEYDEDKYDWLIKLFEFTLEQFDREAFKKSGYYSEGDEKAPFFSEAFLYNLLGKDDARTVLAVLHRALESVGVDWREMQRRAYERRPCPQCNGMGTVIVPGPEWKEKVKNGEIHIRALKVKKGGLVREQCNACEGKG